MVTADENGRDLERLTALIEAGQITPHVDRSYPLQEVPEAMRRLVAGQARGKVAINV
jgi:NADPH:quinone reductase-like Zn-dependent oxidoreductase